MNSTALRGRAVSSVPPGWLGISRPTSKTCWSRNQAMPLTTVAARAASRPACHTGPDGRAALDGEPVPVDASVMRTSRERDGRP